MSRGDDLRLPAGFRRYRDAVALSSDDGAVAAGQSAAGLCACGRRLPLLLSADEVAALLRTSRRAVYSMLERGQLPGVVRIGRRVLFRSDDLVGWLAGCRTPSP